VPAPAVGYTCSASLGLCETLAATDKAGSMLADIYNWFTEGFDTTDLKDAKALPHELNN